MSSIFPLLFASNDVKALMGSDPMRVYSFSQAPKDSAVPYVTYSVIGGQPQNEMDKSPSVDIASTQVDIWAATEEQSAACFEAIRDVLEEAAHMTSFSVVDIDPETKLYHRSMDFDFFEDR
jgi:hypothetical protein